MTKYLGFKGIKSNNNDSKYNLDFSVNKNPQNYYEESGNVDTDDIVDAELNEFNNINSQIYDNEEKDNSFFKIDYLEITKLFLCIVILMVFRYADSKQKAKSKENYMKYDSPEYGERYNQMIEEAKKLDEKYKNLLNFHNKSVQQYYQNSKQKPVYKIDFRKFNKSDKTEGIKNNSEKVRLNNTNNEDLLKNNSSEKYESKQPD